MKRLIAAAAAAFSLVSTLAAQGANFAQARSDHYAVWAETGQARAEELAKVLESLYTLFEEDMRFDSKRLAGRLTVRVFRDKAGFDAHLTQIVGQTNSDFVYLHYPTLERSELLVFEKENPAFSASLAHQAYKQYLKAFIPNPPLWILEGFPVYYERAAWDKTAGAVVFRENTAWLETLKALQNSGKLLGIEALLSTSPERSESARDVFYPQSWAFVSFLLDGREPRYARFLWDSLALLSPAASLEENQRAVSELFRRWHDSKTAQEDFLAWLGSRKTFAELVEEGVRLYGEKNLKKSAAAFAEALAKNEGNCIPYYYLGLISYAGNDFDMADYYYKTALQLGCDPATTNFALGLTAFAVNRLEDAKAYLAKAKSAAPDRYAARVDEILGRMVTP